jgi:hypothetical protein
MGEYFFSNMENVANEDTGKVTAKAQFPFHCWCRTDNILQIRQKSNYAAGLTADVELRHSILSTSRCQMCNTLTVLTDTLPTTCQQASNMTMTVNHEQETAVPWND